MEKVDWRIVIGAMVCLTILEVIALLKGVNGTILALTMTMIAGLAGYLIKSPIQLK